MQLTPRQRLFLINISDTAAGAPGFRVACDPAKWFGRKLTSADRVKAHRTYSQLERRGLVQRHPWCDGTCRRFKTAALSLTPAGEAVAASLGAAAESSTAIAAAPSGALLTPIDQSPVATPATPPAPIITTGDDQLSRQSDFSRRKQSEVAEIGPLPEVEPTPTEPAAVADPSPETPANRGYVSVINGGTN